MTIDRRRFYHKRDRLKRFRAFCQVAQSGSITRAAERLDLGQPSVSQQVRSLETELGGQAVHAQRSAHRPHRGR